MTQAIWNFGRNLRFAPGRYARPQSEEELLQVLQSADGPIRVVGSRHAWSDGIVTSGTLIEMSHFQSLQLLQQNGQTSVEIGAGCQIKHVLRFLNQHGLTLPSVGLVSEQTIAGATATGTHGSGKHSLSHYVSAVRLASFANDGRAVISDVRVGDELRAARCSLGCLGVVVAVTMPCVPQYHVRERISPESSMAAVLQSEAENPLQQFFLIPHLWSYYIQQRLVAPTSHPSHGWWLYRVYWYVCIDVALHVLVKLSASVFRSRMLIRGLFRQVLPRCILTRVSVTDRSDRMLIMEHELFRHLELESFVPDVHLEQAADFVRAALQCFAGEPLQLDDGEKTQLAETGLLDRLEALQGRYVHHYAVCFRRVLRDDTLISASSGQYDAWYAISFITYVEPRDAFRQAIGLLAECLRVLFEARVHWGKWFPHEMPDVRAGYPRMEDFVRICRRHDPEGRFANPFIRRFVYGESVVSDE